MIHCQRLQPQGCAAAQLGLERSMHSSRAGTLTAQHPRVPRILLSKPVIVIREDGLMIVQVWAEPVAGGPNP